MPATSLIRSALRPLVQRPAWAAIVIAGLAIGIAANTSIFSLVHGVLLDPLPYADPDRLVTVWEDHGLRDGPSDEWTGYATFLDWRDESTVFDALAAYSGWAPNLGGEGDPEQLVGLAVTRDWFRVLGVAPSLGRGFTDEEDRPGGAS
ncbi:MAG: ABC transporter permease, partial [Acidobacteriota bacterium]